MKKSLSINGQIPPSIWLQIDSALRVTPMDHLYAMLDAMYPGRWRANFTTSTAIEIWKETWAQAFDRKKLTPKQFKNGLEQCLDLFKWPPSLPEFLEACFTVLPLMHRSAPVPKLTGKATPEGTAKGLRELREFTAGMWGE